MEFNYLVEKNRMCKSMNNNCLNCGLFQMMHENDNFCGKVEWNNPLEATELVRKWALKHPRKTRKAILKEAFPNAFIDDNCVRKLGLCSKEDCRNISGDMMIIIKNVLYL